MTVNTNHIATFPLADYRPALWERWVALRNGDLAHAEEIVAPALALHTPAAPSRLVAAAELARAELAQAEHGTVQPGPRGTVAQENVEQGTVPTAGWAAGAGQHRVGGRRALLSWIAAMQTAVPAGRFTVQVGPIINGSLIAGHWVFSRDGQADRPAATHAITGTDILRVHDGQVIELWINHNLLGRAACAQAVAA